MSHKFTEEQLDMFIESVGMEDGFEPNIVIDLLSSEELRNKYLQSLEIIEKTEMGEDLTDDELELLDNLDDMILKDFSLQIPKDSLNRLTEIEDSNKRARIVSFILDNSKEYGEEITPEEKIDLIILTEDFDYIHDWINEIKEYYSEHTELEYAEFQSALQRAYDRLEKKQLEEELAQAKKEGYHALYETYAEDDPLNDSFIPSDEKLYDDFDGYFDIEGTYGSVFKYNDIPEGASPLRITDTEKYAAKIYEGAAPGANAAGKDSSSYKTLNTLMFPGYENEFVRIFEDRQQLNPAVLYETDELLKINHYLLSAMYKHGLSMEKPYHVRRVDRSQSFDEITERGETVSNFSTTLNFFQREFNKAHVTLVEADIEPGALCFNFGEILKGDYVHKTENEVLVGPFNPLEIIKTVPQEELNVYEKDIKDYSQNPPDKKYVMKIKAMPKAVPLTDEEKQDKQNKIDLLSDEKTRRELATFLAKLNSMGRMHVSKERALEIIPDEIMGKYLMWKNTLHDVIKYDLRETMVELDKQYEEWKKKQEPEVEQEQAEDVLVDDNNGPNQEELEKTQEMPTLDIQQNSTAAQMIADYKKNHGNHGSSSENVEIKIVPKQVTQSSFERLTTSRRLSKINKAILAFKARLGSKNKEKQDGGKEEK